MDSLWSQFSKNCPIQLMQHNMISIDIFLPSIPSSSKVIPTKQNNPQTNKAPNPLQNSKTWRKKNYETIKKKTREVNKIAVIEHCMCFLFQLHHFGSNKNLWEKNFSLPHVLLFFSIVNPDAG